MYTMECMIFVVVVCLTSLSTVAAQPSIIASGRALEGQITTFKCTELSAGAPVTIIWTRVDKIGNPIGGEEEGLYDSNIIAGVFQSISTLKVNISRTDDQSKIMCTTTTTTGRLSSKTYRIYVDVLPSIPKITGPDELSEGQNVTYVCIVDEAKPAATITWRWSTGAPITNDNSRQPQLNEDGTYKSLSEVTFIATQTLDQRNLICEADHHRLTAEKLTDSIKISVVYKPSVFVSKVNYETRVGDVLIIDCSVNSNPPATSVGWLKNDSELVIDSGYAIGSNTNPSLTIKRVVEGDAGVYICTATNDAGTLKSPPVRVQVKYIPKVTIPGTKSFRLEEGDRVTFQCQVDSNPEANAVIWTKSGSSLIPLDTTVYEGSSTSSPSLVIKNVTKTDTGAYQCTAENNVGTGKSADIVNLVVNFAPTVANISPASSTTITENNPFSLQCTSDGEPTPQYQWIKGGVVVGTGAVYNVQSAGPDHHGEYTCKVSNPKGEVSRNVQVNVRYTPRVNIPENVYAADALQSVTIPCSYRAEPAANFAQWFKGTVPLDIIASGGKYSGGSLANTSLTINTLGSGDTGTYKCTVRNDVATGEDIVQVDISFAPASGQITNNDPTPKEGDPVTLTCGASGVPTPKYMWYRNGAVVSSGSTLTLASVSTNDAGQYTCTATNEKGSQNVTTSVDVQYSPKLKFTNDVKVVGGEFTVQIPLEVNSNPVVTRITWFRNGLPFSLTPASKYTGGTTINPSLTINNLTPSDNGVYQVEVQNDIGTTRSPTINVTGLFPPSNIRVEPDTVRARENEPVTVQCYCDGSPTPEYYWIRGIETTRYSSGDSRLAIAAASPADNTHFTCWATNSAGIASTSVIVQVLYKPKSSVQTTRYPVNEGDVVRLTCTTFSNPPPTAYKWWYKDILLPETSVNLTVEVNNTLFGEYVCRAINGEGESNDITFFLEADTTPRVKSAEESTGLSLTYIVLIVLIIIILLALIIIAIIFCCKQGLCSKCGKKRTNSRSRVNPSPSPPAVIPTKAPIQQKQMPLPFSGYTSSSSTVSRQDVEVNMNGNGGRARPKTARIRLEDDDKGSLNHMNGPGPIISIMEPEFKSPRPHHLPSLGHDPIEETPVKKMKRKRKRRSKPEQLNEEDEAALTSNVEPDRETPISE